MLNRNLGCGNFGEVEKCVHIATQVVCAVKIIKKNYLNGKGELAKKAMRQELITLQEVDHHHCARVM